MTSFRFMRPCAIAFCVFSGGLSGRASHAETIVSVTQYAYDTNGWLECTAIRMNSATYFSLPSSACSLGAEGGYGPDRVTQNLYDAAGQLIQVRKAVGTLEEVTEATYAYSANGKQADVIDASGNHAQFIYDGFDRQIAWIFPSDTPPLQRSVPFDGSSQATALATAGAVASCNIGQVNGTHRVWPDGASTDYSGPVDARSSGDDCEKYSYDANGNRIKLVKRDGAIVSHEYDGPGREVYKEIFTTRTALPSTDPAYLPAVDARSVYYSYDLQGHQITARFDNATGEGVTNVFDGLGRQTSSTLTMDGVVRTASYQYDAHGNRTRVTYPDQNYVTYNYDGLDRPTTIQRSAAADTTTYCPGTSPLGTIASYCYNGDGTRASFNGAGNGIATAYSYDAIDRIASIANVTASASYANTYGFGYNAASQITSLSKSNNLFVFNGTYNVNRAYGVNGLNQYTGAGSASFAYDANGNLTDDGSTTFIYDIENRLVSAGGNRNAQLRYDPMGRLYEVAGPSGTTRLFYDGDALIGEYDGFGNLLRRYVHGADLKSDDPIAWYEGAGFDGTSERFLRPDWQGSIGLVTDNAGANVYGINTFDEYGIPGANNLGRFQYTGQAWVPELGMYYYKARFYSPTLGRFMQTDPIGYKDQINLYAYVQNDPMNGVDPSGMAGCGSSLSKVECGAAMAAQDAALKRTNESLAAVRELKNERADIAAGKRDGLSRGALRTEATIKTQTKNGPNLTNSDLDKVENHFAFTASVLSSNEYTYEKGSRSGATGHTGIGFSTIYLDPPFFRSTFSYQAETLYHEPNHIIGSNFWPWQWPERYGSGVRGLGDADAFSNIIKNCRNWCGN